MPAGVLVFQDSTFGLAATTMETALRGGHLRIAFDSQRRGRDWGCSFLPIPTSSLSRSVVESMLLGVLFLRKEKNTPTPEGCLSPLPKADLCNLRNISYKKD